MSLKTTLCSVLVLIATGLPAQTDAPANPTYRHRTYFVLIHLINPYQPTAIIGREFRLKGPNALALEGAYMFGTLHNPPSHGYRTRASYRYYLPLRDPKADPKYLTIMAAWQQRFQRASGWYDRFGGQYQEYLTGARTWKAVRLNAGIGFLVWGKKKRYWEFLIAPGVRWVLRTAYDFPADVQSDGDFWDPLEDNKWLMLPDFTFHLSFGKAR